MKTEFTIFSAWIMPDGLIALAGHYSGEPLIIGQRLRTATSAMTIVVKIVSIGIVDPILVEETMRQGLLAELISGDLPEPIGLMDGATFAVE
jgi:hypothetical protein